MYFYSNTTSCTSSSLTSFQAYPLYTCFYSSPNSYYRYRCYDGNFIKELYSDATCQTALYNFNSLIVYTKECLSGNMNTCVYQYQPTPTPTAVPTTLPTPNPTTTPTVSPTRSPTQTPTVTPAFVINSPGVISKTYASAGCTGTVTSTVYIQNACVDNSLVATILNGGTTTSASYKYTCDINNVPYKNAYTGTKTCAQSGSTSISTSQPTTCLR